MRTLSGQPLEPEKQRPDMSEMVIANMHENCEKCPVNGEGCDKKVNTLKCMITKKRFLKKQVAEQEQKEEEEESKEDKELKAEQEKSLKEYMESISVEEKDDKEDDEDD